MILIKSKIYEERMFVPEICDKKYRRIYDRDFRRIRYEKVTTYEYEHEKKFVIKYAVLGGYEKLIGYLVSRGIVYWTIGMASATSGGHKKLIDFFISKGAKDWNWGMYEAIEGDHEKLVYFFISKGAEDWHSALWSASRNKHKKLEKYFKNKLK